MPEYRRKLPHIQPEGVPIFLTWRLHGSLPACAIEKVLKPDPGAASGPRWLTDPRIARLVAQTILIGETERRFYELHAWVIMANHVHLLITPKAPVAGITLWIKGSTAREANRLRGTTGNPFWQDESWDRWIRNAEELRKTVRYIEQNPVSAGMALHAEQWAFSSAGWDRRFRLSDQIR